MPDWLDALSVGTVSCRVIHDKNTVCKFTPTLPEQLWVPFLMHDTGGTVRSEFW